MIVYLIKMTVCALLLYAIYVLMLERENMHHIKRIYLLVALVFAITVPFTAITINVPQIPASIDIFAGFDKVVVIADKQPLIVEPDTQVEEIPAITPVNYFTPIVSAYILVTFLFLFRLLRNFWQILVRGRNNVCMDYHGARIALIREKTIPHSFGQYIFLNKEDYDNGQIVDEVIVHEWTHVQQKHTWDIVFIELLIAFGWFNPVFYLYRNKIRQNHEFLADDAVINGNKELVPAYQTILIHHIPQMKNISFASNFNFNFIITKKRIVMITKEKSKKRAWCISLALIPVFIAAICVFSTKTIAQTGVNTLSGQTTGSVANPVTDNDRMITLGKGVSEELLTEYQEIVDKYLERYIERSPNKSDTAIWKTDRLTNEDLERLYVIFVQMTESQRIEQKIYFMGPIFSHTTFNIEKLKQMKSPPPLRMYNSWKAKKYQIWIDGGRVENSILNSHTRNDFAYYFVSSLLRSEFGLYGQSGKIDEFRVDLWTTSGLEKYCQQFIDQPFPIDKLLEIEPNTAFLIKKDDKFNTYLCDYAATGGKIWFAFGSGISYGYGSNDPTKIIIK